MPDSEQHASTHDTSRIGILGGTFDPPHIGHLIIAQEALIQLGLDTVCFVPAAQPPHKATRSITPPARRKAMVELAIAGNAAFSLSSIELDRPGPSYTVDTLRALHAVWGREAALQFIVGWDMLLDLPHWRDPAGVVAECAAIVAVHRPGYEADPAQLNRIAETLPDLPSKLVLLPTPQIGVSATDLRARVASGLPIRYLVPDGVANYIAAHALYRDPAVSRTARGDAGQQPGDYNPGRADLVTREEARP